MLDLHSLAAEYLDSKEQVRILKGRIDKIKRQESCLPDLTDIMPTEEEENVLRIVGGWRKQLLVHELMICKYEMVASTLSSRERMILHLHFEKGIPLRQIVQMNLEQYSIKKISLSTLNRNRKSVVNKFERQMDARKPLSTGVLE